MNIGLKVLITWVCICALLSVAGFNTPVDTPVNAYVGVNYTTETVVAGDNFTENVGMDYSQEGYFAKVKDLFAPLIVVKGAMLWLGGFFFVPLTALTGVQAPFAVVLILGVVPIVILAIAVISFLRGYGF